MPMHDLNCTHPKPHFTRMHHQMIATALHEFSYRYPVAANIASDYLAVMFEKDNHLFDLERFKTAVRGDMSRYR